MIELSIVVSAYSRPKELVNTLRNLSEAAEHFALPYELIVVDDGSSPSLESLVEFSAFNNIRVITQSNQGSAASRRRGVLESVGEYVFLSDCDDFVAKDKFTKQLAVMKNLNADCSFCREEKIWFNRAYEIDRVELLAKHSPIVNSVELLIGRDLRSNNLIFRGDLIRSALQHPILSPRWEYSPAGDHYIYYNLVPYEMRLAEVDEVLSSYCMFHSGQLSEKRGQLAFSALRLNEDFLQTCPPSPQKDLALKFIAERVYKSWRKLPKRTPKAHLRRLEKLMAQLPPVDSSCYGGANFQAIAAILGPLNAGRILRQFYRRSFATEFSISKDEYRNLFEQYLNHSRGVE